MKPAIAITLIVCGTVVAAMPVIAHRLGFEMADLGSLLYMALGAVMVISAIAGSFVSADVRPVRGFETLPVDSAA
jgi:FtsH-binding integral membrane protein